MNYWVKTRGCPRHKVILGVPFYGKVLKPDGKEDAVAYKDVSYQDRLVHQRDNAAGVYYNGIATIEKKARLAAELGGGIMIWEVAQDSRDETSLLGAIAKLAATFPEIPVVSVRKAPAARPASARTFLAWDRDFTATGRALAPAASALP
jgi:GH18 family chitinase